MRRRPHRRASLADGRDGERCVIRRLRARSGSYGAENVMLVNALLVERPRNATAPTITIAINASIKAYSTAVAPSWSSSRDTARCTRHTNFVTLSPVPPNLVVALDRRSERHTASSYHPHRPEASAALSARYPVAMQSRSHARVALVTGAGSPDGIGFATAAALGRQGARLAICSTTGRIHDRAGELRSSGCHAMGFAADLTDRAQV